MEIADFVIHIHDELSTTARAALESEIGDREGVISAHFSHDHPHLLNIAYNPDATSSGVLLQHVSDHGVAAFKVGL